MQAILIAGTHSGCGKTTITLGILAALRKKGLTVQPFKTGPDFIDAGLHRLVVDRPSRNLDLWMCGQDYVRECFAHHAADADIAVVEGVMGLYDGELSTARLAQLLHVPVVLVVDAYGMAESAGAVVKGFVEFGSADERPGFAGVIFNRVASDNHYNRLKDSVRGVPVLGYLPRDRNFEIPHRHLGLAVAEESPLAAENIDNLADTVLAHVDVDALVRNAGIGAAHGKQESYPTILRDTKENGKIKIAVAYDKAFCFYYQDNLDLLQEAGVGIVLFSPLLDRALPDNIDAVYIGGGYPELHAEALSGNGAMIASIQAWSQAGKPMYAECGGLMYLSHGIRDFENRFHAMAGLFPFDTGMLKKPRLGYREIVLKEDCIIGNKGEKLRGHEFHYSEISDTGGRGRENAYSTSDSKGRPVDTSGFRYKNTLASYVHVHFGSNRRIAKHVAGFIKGESVA